MIDVGQIRLGLPVATDGEIAAGNLASARAHSWSRFWRMPERPGTAELLVEQELLTAQFAGDLAAFDRLESLLDELARVEPNAARTSLIAAQVAGATHRFSQARAHLAQAVARGLALDAIDRMRLTLDQATGNDLSAVLAARRARAAQPGHWDELVPLGALLADLGEFDEAERVYLRALQQYPEVSPFAPAWICFLLGALWGEQAAQPQTQRAAHWYRAALKYLPCYVKARVHLAEIYLDQGNFDDARFLLTPALTSGDPEVSWRLADVAEAAGDLVEAASHMSTAHIGFEALLAKYPLAFADHGAEFYTGSGGDPERAFALAQMNFANRPTRRAFEQARATAIVVGQEAELIGGATYFTQRLEHAHATT